MKVIRHGDAAEIVFDSPPVNAYSIPFLESVADAMTSLPSEVIAVVVTSSVDRIFAAGGDLKFMAAANRAVSDGYVTLVQETYSLFESTRYATIAAIDGACLGGGMELALACDIRIASRGARLGLPEVGLGIIAGGGAIHRLVRAVGQGIARDMLITGEPVGAEQAHSWGLVSRLVDADAATAGRELAIRLAAGAPEAIRATKELAMAASTTDLATGLRNEYLAWMDVRTTFDAQEGLEAFAERRPPRYGRT